MRSVRRSLATRVFAVAVATLSMLPAAAQFRGASPYTPEPGSRELRDVLYNWTWHMGMLRGQAEPELVGTLEYRAQGTVQIDGQACELSKYRISANYQLPGYRTQIECTLANGEPFSNDRLPMRQ